MSAGKIIKQPSIKGKSHPAGGIVKREIVDARAEAERILAEAEAEAAQLRISAETEARDARETAYQQGMESALLKLNQDLIAAREKRDAAIAEVERDVLRLAVKIAEKIIAHEIDRDDETIARIVGSALRHARQSEAVTVRVNPAALPVIENYREQFDTSGRIRFLDFVPDPRVNQGGCVIVTDTGTIDAQLDTQLRILERALLQRAAGDHP